MRADRLLSILLLLQVHGQQTAYQLADQLEVSERTIYRDVIALSTAGVPIYTERGPGGGIALIEDYRTTLTGLTREEVRALFMLSIPVPLADLGFDQDLRGALLKLSAALPKSMRGDREQTLRRIYIDSAEWEAADEPVPHLRTIQGAVWDERMLYIRYNSILGMRSAPLDARVKPYGLVSKAGVWYLVCMKERQLNRGFIQRMTATRPYIRSKIAMSIDGRTALASGESKWITSPAARRDVHRLRARSSAILTGINTVLADDPALTARIEEGVLQPLRIVLDSHLQMPLNAQLARLPGRSLILTCCSDQDKIEKLKMGGFEIHSLPEKNVAVSI